MEVSKAQLTSGISRYVRNEMLPKINDRGFKMAISAAVNLIELRPEVADKVLENPIFMAKNGMYDLDTIEMVLTRTLEEYGDLPIVIPGIPFVSPDKKELRFSAEDIRRMKGYIMG